MCSIKIVRKRGLRKAVYLPLACFVLTMFIQDGLWVKVGYAQTPPAALATNASGSITIDAIQQTIEKIERSKEIDDAAKASIVALYQEAIQDLLRADTWKEKSQNFDQEKRSAIKNIEQAKTLLAQKQSKQPLEIPDDASIRQLERSLVEFETELAAAKEKVAKAEVEPRRRTIRLLEIKQLLKDARRRTTKLEQQREALPKNGSSGPLETAQQVRLLVALESAKIELIGYDKELEAQKATTDLLPLEHDLAIQEVARANAKVAEIKKRLSAARQLEAAEQIRDARQKKATMADPSLQELANINEELARERQELINVTKESTDKLALQQKKLVRFEKELKSVKDKLKSAGRTKTISLFLKAERVKLPDTHNYLESIEARQPKTIKTQSRIFELAEKRADLTDLEESISVTLKELESDSIDSPAYKQNQVKQELLATQKKYIDQLARDYYQHFSTQVELDTVEQDLVEKINDYRAYIDEQVLWIRSAFPMWDPASWKGRLDLDQLLEPVFWRSALKALVRDLYKHSLLWAGAAIVLVALFSARYRARSRLHDLGKQAESSGMQRFLPTVQAALLTLLLTAPITMLLAFIAWRFSFGMGGVESIRTLNAAIWGVMLVFLPIEWFRQMCCQQGLAASHFGWPSSAVIRIRHSLTRIVLTVAPIAFITIMLHSMQSTDSQETIGRLCFIACLCLVLLTMHFLVRKRGEVFRAFLASQPEGRTQRSFFFIYLLLVFPPFLLVIITIFGYYFTAWRLTQLWLQTVLLMALLLVVGAFFLRWTLVTRRRLAIQRARQERESNQAKESQALEGEATDDPKTTPTLDMGPDLATISMQTRRLLYIVLGFTAALGLWLIWDDVFPALGVLKYVELWSISGSSPLAIGKIITLADLAWAILIASLTFVAARNIPGLLEMSLLHRLPMDKGLRFATTTVCRYLLVVIGIVWACNHIGLGWGKVQWILAAMSVGLGFGLQEIFANFVSGMVILFERPIRIGDIITIGDATGKVSKIQMRATTIIDWDKKELVVPNKEFATGRILNWTLTDTTNRLIIEVGVSYDSDPDRVREILLQCAADHPKVVDSPKPICIFREFGNSALMFSLRIYLASMKGRLDVIHEMNTQVHRSLREAGIEIAYPQLDLHVRSNVTQAMDGSLGQIEGGGTVEQ